MKSKFKIFLTFILFLIIGLIISLSLIIGGTLTHSITTPYGDTVINSSAEISEAITTNAKIVETSIPTKFEEIDEYGNYDSITKPYCQIGGLYTIDVSLDVSKIPEKFKGDTTYQNFTFDEGYDLYYCQTIKDFIDKIKIPSSWSSSNLVVYCNDGSLINVESTNFDLFTTKVSTYKGCIVKNLDVDDQSAIFYGMEVGNKKVDSDETYFYDPDTKTGPVLTELSYKDGNYVDKNDRVFYLNYDEENKIVAIMDFEASLSSPLNGVFSTENLGLSRIAFFKKINGKKIIGYETITKKATFLPEYESSLKTLYTIELEGFDFDGSVCDEILAQYKTSQGSTITPGVEIVCNGNTIQIISESLDGSGTSTSSSNTNTSTNTNTTTVVTSASSSSSTSEGKSFHIFKNIILNLK